MLTWMILACIEPESGRFDVTLESTASDCADGEAATAATAWTHRLFLQEDNAEVVAFGGPTGTCPFNRDAPHG